MYNIHVHVSEMELELIVFKNTVNTIIKHTHKFRSYDLTENMYF